MSSYRIIHNASKILSRVSAHGLPETAAAEMGYRFRTVDRLLTNFHTPESTLLMLVSALAGREHIMAAYEHAIAQRYRFYSYGDAMFIR